MIDEIFGASEPDNQITEEEPESITIAELDAQAAKEKKMTIDEVFNPIEEEEPIFYHDSSYVSSYIRMGLDMSELFKLSTLFENKKVHVDLKITVL